MLYNVTHMTSYSYTEPVSLCHNLVHLRPRAAPRQTCHHSRLLVQPEPRAVEHQHDYFGNPIALFTIQEPHKKLSITAKNRIEVTPGEPIRLQESPAWEKTRDALKAERGPAALQACQFALESSYVPCNAELAAYADLSFTPGRPLLEAVKDLTERIHKDFRYDAKATKLATPLAEVLQHRCGVCQDFAHLEIGCLRSRGLAARYVSGYLQTRVPAGRERLIGADASHAWVAVFCPKMGWIDFDPTNNMIPSEQHVTIAWGRDYDDISPIKGVILGGGTHTMSITVDVAPVS
jgi:transglutaminase-like putative cysteine protease